MIDLKIKKLTDKAVIPSYAKDGDGCFDLTATWMAQNNQYIEYGTGLAMEIPKGYVGLIFPRSSVTKKNMMLKNSVGVIDSGYRGEIRFRFFDVQQYSSWVHLYEVGDRVGQMMIIERPTVNFIEVDELEDSERGEGGYGSTGL